ncbi:hypothetical protein BKA57DRAFT_146560 [Linnemannia elongata]|nr:hypothetical protein BGZ91_007808 [Linnemannia elongata]KAG0075482.1 hypothetical protein BGZ90_009854 [Linnemannia elongata]KAH7058288.1 hypothetical protein BKA57DRAFT_146560 [Linnemannia elongata]
MTTVGSLPADLAPSNEAAGKSAMDLPPSPTNSVPFIVATSADDDKIQKPMAGPINGGSPMRFLQACSKLDMEPNPFEQSFAGGASSEKAGSAGGPSTETGLETPKPVLPPIASMSGRLAPGTDQFGWDAQSLRMGPLSPSMLEGPQQPINIEGKSQNPLPIGTFPPAAASINTVFTSGAPMAENGLPFVGLPGPLPVPPVAVQSTEPYPPSVYNQPHPMAQPQPQPSHQQQQPPSHPPGPPGGPGSRPPQHFTHPTTHQQQHQQPHDRYMPPQAPQQNMANNNSHINQYGNLHLLSQQAQASRGPWIKRESTDSNGGAPYNQPPHPPHAGHPHHPQNHPHPSQSHSNAHPGPHQNNGQGIPGVGSHPPRNSVDSGFNQGTRRSRMTSEDYSDDSEQSSKNSANGGDNSNKKKAKPGPVDDKMDEEEKRKNFLERNRQAALKCRQRKKQWLTNLQAKVEYLTNDNEHLQGQTAALRDEIIHLKALLLAHKDCPVAQANGVYADSIGLPGHSGNMMNHSRPPHPMQQQQQAGPLRGGPGPGPGQPRGSLPPPPPSQLQQHPQGPGPMQGGPRMMNQPGPGPIAQQHVGPMGNVVGGGRPMSMMQDITPSASPSQGQANGRY